ncbi:NAD(P)-binding protein [Coprinopsis sp. MPI-PUGE-AT-0042]|nr:NAD(P)-binding protein [Coprinopsis sp. MPI-PUGE-AT-0042]
MTITQAQDAPLVVVGGATGYQGGSVIRFLADSPKAYRIRALTRDAMKPKAKSLADQDIEVVSINITADNKAKIVEAYAGADAVFSVTNFWEHMDFVREEGEGKVMIDAAIEAHVKLFIFSALPSPKKYSNGKYSQGRAKLALTSMARARVPIPSSTALFMLGSTIPTCSAKPSPKKNGSSGKWTCKMPLQKDTKIPSIDIDEYGLWVRAVIENEAVKNDTRPVLTVSEWVSMDHIIKTIGKKSGTPLSYEQVDGETYIKTLPPDSMPDLIKTDLAESWAAFDEFGYYGGEDTDWILPCLSRKPTSFAEWAEKTDLSQYSG